MPTTQGLSVLKTDTTKTIKVSVCSNPSIPDGISKGNCQKKMMGIPLFSARASKGDPIRHHPETPAAVLCMDFEDCMREGLSANVIQSTNACRIRFISEPSHESQIKRSGRKTRLKRRVAFLLSTSFIPRELVKIH